MPALTLCRVANRDDLVPWQEVMVASYAADHDRLPADPLEEWLPTLAGPMAGEREELWVALDGSEPVAAVGISFSLLDNLESAHVDLRVHPAHRRAGHGSRMFQHVLDRLRADGRTRLFTEIAQPLAGAHEPAGVPFAAGCGFRRVLNEVRRMLVIADVDDAELARLRSEAESHAGGYSLVQWVDHAPARWYDDMARLTGRMSVDAPLEDMQWEPEHWDAERFVASEKRSDARGRQRFTTAVLHEASGHLVGYTDIGINRMHRTVGYQWDTIVAGDHRGHRLGLLLKIANLDLLRSHSPVPQIVNTWNADSNEHMIAINEAIGFRAVDRWWEWQLDL